MQLALKDQQVPLVQQALKGLRAYKETLVLLALQAFKDRKVLQAQRVHKVHKETWGQRPLVWLSVSSTSIRMGNLK